MTKFLLDANLSPKTAKYLRNLGYDAISVSEKGMGTLTDLEIVEFAKKSKRVIITFDLDFGEIYHFRESSKIGIIVLRLENQTPENVNLVLERLLSEKINNINKS